MGNRIFRVALLAALLGTVLSEPAFAYVDPNAGSFLFQLLTPITAIVTVWLVFLRDSVKAIWHAAANHIIAWFRQPRQH